MTLADEVALLAIAIERAGDDPEALILVRLEFESVWTKFKKDTQGVYDSYRVDAEEEFRLQLERDRA